MAIPRIPLAGAILVWSMLLAALIAADAGVPDSLEQRPLEQRLIADARDGRLDQFSLFEAALIGSGVAGEDELRQRSAEFGAIAQQLRAACDGQPAAAQVQSIFHFTHQRFLTGQYDAECSDLQRTVNEGRFNCVTATVIFHGLCEHAGLEPQIVAVPGHVYSHFQVPGVEDVQTTCAEWFQSPRDRPLDDKFNDSRRRIITPVQLLGKIYYNAGIALLEERSYERAVVALELSQRLDAEDRAARDNLLAAINNWSLAEEDAGNVERASELIERGLQLDPAYGPLLANDLHIHQKRALALCDAGRYAEAWGLLERCRVRRPDVPLYDAGAACRRGGLVGRGRSPRPIPGGFRGTGHRPRTGHRFSAGCWCWRRRSFADWWMSCFAREGRTRRPA